MLARHFDRREKSLCFVFEIPHFVRNDAKHNEIPAKAGISQHEVRISAKAEALFPKNNTKKIFFEIKILPTLRPEFINKNILRMV